MNHPGKSVCGRVLAGQQHREDVSGHLSIVNLLVLLVEAARPLERLLAAGRRCAILIAAGTIALASDHIDTSGWIVMAPVVVVMLYLLLGT